MFRYLPLVAVLVACGGEEPVDATPEIVGTYVDDFGSEHVITETTWTMYGNSVFHILDVDNEGDWLVAQNDAANEYNPDLYSRMEWYDDGTTLWFCQSVFDAATEADALAADPADVDALDTDGCGGFPWSQLLTP